MEEANKLLGAGKRFMVMGKPLEAAGVLQEACGMLAKEFGDTADECGEAYLWCGKALLDLARMENSVLGNALEGMPEEDESGEDEEVSEMDEKLRDKLREQVYLAMAEREEQRETSGERKVKAEEEEEQEREDTAEGNPEEDQEEEEEGEKPKEEEEEEGEKPKEEEEEEGEKPKEEEEEEGEKPKEEEEVQEEAEQEEGEEKKADKGAEGDAAAATAAAGKLYPCVLDYDAAKDSDEEEGEEVGNLQLAWEMLEVAKTIFKRKDTKEQQLAAAEAHLKLGEVSSESGNYMQALEDLQECLRLQQRHLEPDSRLLAETHYQLGLTFALSMRFGGAVEAFHNSICVIRSRLENLERLLEAADSPDSLPNERKELEELRALLPEIQQKLEDASKGQRVLKTVEPGEEEEGEEEEVVDGTVTAAATDPAPASEISDPVNKKRKSEEGPAQQDQLKKVKNQNQHKPDSTSSGHAEVMRSEK